MAMPVPRYRAAHVEGSCARGDPCRYAVLDATTGEPAAGDDRTLAEADEAARALNEAEEPSPDGAH